MTDAVVRMRGVRKAYDDGRTRHDVLRGADLDVHAGSVVALVGPSGSGKSTLLNLIAGIDSADAGTVHVAGHDVAAMTEHDRTLMRRRRIGFVFQFFNLIPTLTVIENVRFPLELAGRRDDTEARALLDRVGLAARADSYPDELSGGEQQRIAVARAVVHSPALLLADEPTGNLDAATGTAVLDLLMELATERGTAMLIATHSPDVLARAHRAVALQDGVLVPVHG